MLRAVADTHAFLWAIAADLRLSQAVRAFIERAATTGDHIGVSTISLVEMTYLAERGRIGPAAVPEAIALLRRREVFIEISVSRGIARAAARVPRGEVPDMPDRIIAATALHRRVPLITRDHAIRTSRIATIW